MVYKQNTFSSKWWIVIVDNLYLVNNGLKQYNVILLIDLGGCLIILILSKQKYLSCASELFDVYIVNISILISWYHAKISIIG